MKNLPKPNKEYPFSKRWAPELLPDGHAQISNFFLENYHCLKPYGLTHTEAMFVVHLMQYKWDEKAPFPAYKTIAQRMHVSVKSARRYAASLQQKKYLTRQMRVGATNLFHLNGLIQSLVSFKKTKQPKNKRKNQDGGIKP